MLTRVFPEDAAKRLWKARRLNNPALVYRPMQIPKRRLAWAQRETSPGAAGHEYAEQFAGFGDGGDWP
jgi:hypothetical protein